MDVIICLDDKNGMIFNHRRQSRDSKVTEDILKCLHGKQLLISEFSAALFPGACGNIKVEDNPLLAAKQDDICFIENFILEPYEKCIERLIIYRWNRVYPADVYLDIKLNHGWRMISTTEFSGHSHEKITKEIYTR